MPYNEFVREWNRGHIVKYLSPVLLLSTRHISLDPRTFWKRVLFIYAVGQSEIINGISDRARERIAPFNIGSIRERRERAIWNVEARGVPNSTDPCRTKIKLYYDSDARGIHLVSLFLRNNYFGRREIRVACQLEYRAVLLSERESLIRRDTRGIIYLFNQSLKITDDACTFYKCRALKI